MALPSVNSRLKGRGRGAPAGKTDPALRRHAAFFKTLPELCGLLDALPDIILILNGRREVVFANRWMVESLGLDNAEQLLGALPGEVLDCARAWECEHSTCGATEACRMCGTYRALSICSGGTANTQECHIVQASTGRALDLRAVARPLRLHGEPFTLLVLQDIGHEKRRQALERLFFHDMLNLTASILGYAELLQRVEPEEIPELSRLLARMIAELAGELRAQRDLMLAERNDLKVQWGPVSTRQVLNEVLEHCQSHVETGGAVVLDADNADVVFTSDRSLLSRVLSNLVKNALEASPPGHDVTVGCFAGRQWVEFWVHNDGTMPREVQLQVFQRSFSTKGPGRGLGTYSIKLLTERYLRGTVTFSTSSEQGTRFIVRYPRGEDADGSPPPAGADTGDGAFLGACI
ncbi:MAG: PAS domain-containing sensor histidine kinase [Phycisphaerae bacterium]